MVKEVQSTFSHVVRADHIDDLAHAIMSDDKINVAHAPVDIPSAAQTYIEGLDLSQNGDFAHITNPYGHDPSIGPWKSLYFTDFVKDPAQLEPEIIYSKMTELPEREGKREFAGVLSNALKAYWPARQDELGMSGSLMLKYAATNPKFHLDDGTTRRGLITFRGNAEKGATKILDQNAVNLLQRRENGYPFLNPIGEAGVDFELEDHQVMHLPLGHMSIHQGVQHTMRPGFLLHHNEDTGLLEVYTELYLQDIMAEQNPVGHSEPSASECPEPRLQFMMN